MMMAYPSWMRGCLSYGQSLNTLNPEFMAHTIGKLTVLLGYLEQPL